MHIHACDVLSHIFCGHGQENGLLWIRLDDNGSLLGGHNNGITTRHDNDVVRCQDIHAEDGVHTIQ